MARHGNAGGRFAITSFEQPSMYDGIQSELQALVGQTVMWSQFDRACTERDAIYSVGSDTGGRRWGVPVPVKAYGAFVYQGSSPHHERGFFNTDIIRASFDARTLLRAVPTIVSSPDSHLKDRVKFRGALFELHKINLRGVLGSTYTIITVEGQEVTSAESVNDHQYTSNEEDYLPVRPGEDEYLADFSYQSPEQADSLAKTQYPY